MSRYIYIQRNHAIVVVPSQAVTNATPVANPWLSASSDTNIVTTTPAEPTPAPTATSTRAETIVEFLNRINGEIVEFFVNDAKDLYAVIVDTTK